MAAGGVKTKHAIDCILVGGPWIALAQLLDSDRGVVSVVSGSNRYEGEEIPVGVKAVYMFVGAVHDGAYLSHMPKQPEEKEIVKGDPDWVPGFFAVFGGYVG